MDMNKNDCSNIMDPDRSINLVEAPGVDTSLISYEGKTSGDFGIKDISCRETINFNDILTISQE